MTQAVGAFARISYVPEVTWGTTPGTPSMKLLKAMAYGETLAADIEELKSNAVNANRAVEYARGGNINVGGEIPFELPILGIGTLIKHALGSNTDSGSGPYTHTIKRGALPAGLTFEKGYTDISQFHIFTGCKIDKLSIKVDTTGLVMGSLSLKGKAHTQATSSLGTPTAVAHNPYAEQDVSMQEGGSGATILGMDFEITNNLDVVGQIGSRSPAAIREGKGETTGNISLMFEDDTALTKWRSETASSILATFTQGAASIAFNFPNVRYFGDATPKIASDKGLIVPLKFRALYDSGTASDVVCTIINTEATL